MRQNLKTSTGVNPSMFFDIRKSLTIPSVQIKSKPMMKCKVYPFYLTPKQVNDNSMVNYLRNKYGLKVKDKKTFTTPFVSSSVISEFNGSQFYLSLEGDRVYLKVITDKKVSSEVFWNLEDISSSMKSKNSTYKVISPEFIKELISKGYLQVKFNVSKTKDHGTLWKVFITDDEFDIRPKKMKKPVFSDYENDFFSDF
jgi:hypothetical protein